jgi:hypothetical protein
MKLTRLMRTAFAVARSSSVATQVEVQEPTKRESMRILNGILTLIIVGLLIAPIASPKAAGAAKPAPGPTAESGEREGPTARPMLAQGNALGKRAKEASVEQQYSPIIGLAPYFKNCVGRIKD